MEQITLDAALGDATLSENVKEVFIKGTDNQLHAIPIAAFASVVGESMMRDKAIPLVPHLINAYTEHNTVKIISKPKSDWMPRYAIVKGSIDGSPVFIEVSIMGKGGGAYRLSAFGTNVSAVKFYNENGNVLLRRESNTVNIILYVESSTSIENLGIMKDVSQLQVIAVEPFK